MRPIIIAEYIEIKYKWKLELVTLFNYQLLPVFNMNFQHDFYLLILSKM